MNIVYKMLMRTIDGKGVKDGKENDRSIVWWKVIRT